MAMIMNPFFAGQTRIAPVANIVMVLDVFHIQLISLPRTSNVRQIQHAARTPSAFRMYASPIFQVFNAMQMQIALSVRVVTSTHASPIIPAPHVVWMQIVQRGWFVSRKAKNVRHRSTLAWRMRIVRMTKFAISSDGNVHPIHQGRHASRIQTVMAWFVISRNAPIKPWVISAKRMQIVSAHRFVINKSKDV